MQETLTTDDLSEQLLWCVSKKRHTAHKELVEDDAHCPPVHRLSIALSQNDLWCNILWGSTYLYRKKDNKYLNMMRCVEIYIDICLNCQLKKIYLLIRELPGIFLYMSLVQVSGHVHQPNFG